MAAPASKTIKDLNGKWQMNKTLSDNFEPVLALQGVGFITRKAINASTVTLHITQLQAPATPAIEAIEDPDAKVTHVNIDQTLTGGIKGTSENRCVDGRRRAHTDWLFGSVEGRTTWVHGPGAAAAAMQQFGGDAFLADGWPTDGPDAAAGLLVSYVENKDASGGWVATQVWGFQTATDGTRRYVRNVVVVKGPKRVAVKLIYDYVGEREESQEDEDLNY